MSEYRPLPIEEILKDSPLAYFANLHADERLDAAFESTPQEINFNFSSVTKRHLWNDILDHNSVFEGKEATQFQVNGTVQEFNQLIEMNIHLDSIASDPGRPSQGFQLTADFAGNISLHDKYSERSESLTLQEFIDLSLRVGNLSPTKSRRLLRLLKAGGFPNDVTAFYPYWLELAEESEGQTRVVNFVESTPHQQGSISEGVRLARTTTETPDKSLVEIIVEHTRNRFDTDHEVVNRLELEYVSTTPQADESRAERRVFESCAPQLGRVRLFSKDGRASVVELDSLDPYLLAQFKVATELLFESTAMPRREQP